MPKYLEFVEDRCGGENYVSQHTVLEREKTLLFTLNRMVPFLIVLCAETFKNF